MLKDIHKRILLFLFGCITTRFLLVFLAKKADKKFLKLMGIFALLPAFGFLYIYLTNSRKIGAETFGQPIWWNNLRPIHGLLYIIFSYLAINNNNNSYIILLLDVLIGFSAFLYYHFFTN